MISRNGKPRRAGSSRKAASIVSWASRARDDAQRLGVVGDHRARRPARRRPPRGVAAAPTSDVRRRRPRRSASRSSWANSSPSGTSGARTASASRPSPGVERRGVLRASPSRTRAATVVSDTGGGRGRLGRPERLLQAPQRVAQLELAEHLAQPRAVGLARRPRASGSTSTGTSRWIVASTFEIRASSAWSRRFSLRLAPEISSTCSRTPSSVPKAAAGAARRSCRRSPGRPGCCPRCRP